MMKNLIYFSVVGGVLTFLHIFVQGVWARVYGFEAWPVLISSVLVAAVLILLHVLPKIKDTLLTSLLYVFGSTWLGTIFLIFSATVVYQIAAWLLAQDNLYLYVSLHSLAIIAAFYAILNADRIDVKTYRIPLAGIVEPVKLIHLSDIHIGTVHRKIFLQQVVEMTNAQLPDLVLITGDLFDGSAHIYPEMLTPLDSLRAPAYFSNGNHEAYEGLPLVKETIRNLKLQLLENQVTEWNGIEIIGVNDVQSLPPGETLETILRSLSLDTKKPKILMYHTPVNWEVARAHGVGLMLSGHTHNGQVFPFTLLVHLAFRYVTGLYQEGETYLHVTPGTGTWGPPMRLGSRNQITVLELVPPRQQS